MVRTGGPLPRRQDGSPGRPKSVRPKEAVNLRLDADVPEFFRQTAPGWRTRINEALRKAAGP